jgi:hypothetical protein
MADPEMWFTQADSMFRRANIRDSLTKYDYALQRLPCKVLTSVCELARRVHTGVVDDPYGELEAKLTASFQKSPWQRTFELLAGRYRRELRKGRQVAIACGAEQVASSAK